MSRFANRVALGLFVVTLAGIVLLATPPRSGHHPRRPPVALASDGAMTPVADTWIEVPYPPGIGRTPNATPQGAAKALRSGWWDYGINERSLLRFAVPTPMPDMELRRAELELAIAYAGIGTFDPPPVVSGTMHLTLVAVAMPWDEATFTGLDALETAHPVMTAVVPWGPCAPNDCGTARLDIRPLVAAWQRDARANHGLVLDARGVIDRPSTGASFVAFSRESHRPPVLTLGFESTWPTSTPRPTAPRPPSATPEPTDRRTPIPTSTEPPPAVYRLRLPYVAAGPAPTR